MAQQHTIGKASTTIKTNDDLLSVTYHATDVVRYDKKTDIVTLDTGGYKTVTTKRRMNQTSNQFDIGFHVYQSRKKWFVDVAGLTHPFGDKDKLSFNLSTGELINE